MSMMGGSALVGGVVFAKELYHYWKPRRVGIYGPTMAGRVRGVSFRPKVVSWW